MTCVLCGHASVHHPQVLVSVSGEIATAPVWCDDCDDPCWRACICGHGGDDLYVYNAAAEGVLEVMRCAASDPLPASSVGEVFSAPEGTYMAAMHRASDHDYVEAPLGD